MGLFLYGSPGRAELDRRRTIEAILLGVPNTALFFGLWFWEIDRGGPGRRAAGHDGPPDFLFPQMTDDVIMPRNWRPMFIDYLYVSLTNNTAFSPTDTMPLTPQAKSIMGVQSVVSGYSGGDVKKHKIHYRPVNEAIDRIADRPPDDQAERDGR